MVVAVFIGDYTILYAYLSSSIIAIPLVLIGNLYGKLFWGLSAALLGAIAYSYYNRTMAGYYDTDMFSIWLPVFALYFMLRSIEKSSWAMLFYASLLLVFMHLYTHRARCDIWARVVIYCL